MDSDADSVDTVADNRASGCRRRERKGIGDKRRGSESHGHDTHENFTTVVAKELIKKAHICGAHIAQRIFEKHIIACKLV